ncbi:MAG: hypothetical protein JWP61_969 [Friedmanniella sp.]|nr:hypothetical protein [Friedmanniella sp.]
MLVPYLLGFRPRDSAVAVLIKDRRVVLTARVDLPTSPGARALGAQLEALARQHGAEEMVVLLFCDRRSDARPVGALLLEEITRSLLREVLHADGRRWWSLTCGSSCCPAEGTPYEQESHPLAAEAVLAGVVVRDSRAELARLVEGPPPQERDARRAAVAAVAAQLTGLPWLERAVLTHDLVHRAVTADESEVEVAERAAGLGDAVVDRLLVLVRDLPVRDLAWALMDRAAARGHVALWAQVVARAPAEDAAGPLCLLGMAAWIAGDGALLNCCAERVAGVAPSYSMGRLLADVSDRALPPSLWDELVGDLRAQLPTYGPAGPDGG